MKRISLFLVLTLMGVSAVIAQSEKKSKKELKREFIAQGVQYAKTMIESGEFRLTAGGLADAEIARELGLDVFRSNQKPVFTDRVVKSKDTTYLYGFATDKYDVEISMVGDSGKIKVHYFAGGKKAIRKFYMSIIDVYPLGAQYVALDLNEINFLTTFYSEGAVNSAYFDYLISTSYSHAWSRYNVYD